MAVIAETNRTDWTKCDKHNSCEPIRWREWAELTVAFIRGMDARMTNPNEAERAIDMLYKVSDYLDCQYDGGYDGIALVPRENFVLTYDR